MDKEDQIELDLGSAESTEVEVESELTDDQSYG